MRLIALSIVLAGAMIAAALAYGPRERVVSWPESYVVTDRWTGEARLCTRYPGEQPLLCRDVTRY